MRAFAVVTRGLESVAAMEIAELAKAKNISGSNGVVTFELDNLRDFCTIAYRSQSVLRLCCLLAEFEVSSSLAATIGNLKQNLEFNISDWSDGSFSIECNRSGSHGFNSADFIMAASKLIGGRLDFKSQQLLLFCYISGSAGFFGIDIGGDLGKRDYRIFGHSSDLKAPVAYSLARIAGFSRQKALLDPFSRSGSIAIEAALFASGFPVSYYGKESLPFSRLKPFSGVNSAAVFSEIDKKIKHDKLNVFNFSSSIAHVRSSEKNAKIAGVNKLINFARVDLEWLDLKFERDAVGCIVSFPPVLSSRNENVSKLYYELFYQASLILSKAGSVVLAGRDERLLSDAASRHMFKLSEKRDFMMGSARLSAFAFVRQ